MTLKKWDTCVECGQQITMALRSTHSPYCCQPCDTARMARISAQFDALARGVDSRDPVFARTVRKDQP